MARWLSPLFAIISVLHIVSGSCAPPTPDPATHLQINVLIGSNGASTFQCWSIEPPFTISTQPGTVGAKIQALGDATAGTLIFFDPSNPIDAGLHVAPAPQWVMVLQGSGVVSLPTTGASIKLPQGGVIIANDTAPVSKIGHETKWTAGSLVLQMPFKDGIAPKHTIINEHGSCP